MAQQVFKGGPVYLERVDPMVISPFLQHNALLSVLAGAVGCPEAAGLVRQKGDRCLGRGILEPVVALAGGSSCAAAGAPEGHVPVIQQVAGAGGGGEGSKVMQGG